MLECFFDFLDESQEISVRSIPRAIYLYNPKKILFFMLLFLLVFPKGGVKIGDIPLTWGYLLIGIVSLFALFRGCWAIQRSRLDALMCLLPFQIVAGATLFIYGCQNMGWVISFLISFFFLPYVFLLVLSKNIEQMDLNFFIKIFKFGVAVISYYGIALFVYKQFTGRYLEIPLITTNWGDMGILDHGKCNSRGIVSKLISTYNNGQLFGISLIILLPLYCYVQKNSWHKLATKIALILTLSRTAWIGLLFNELAYSVLVAKNKRKGLLNLLIMLSLLGGGVMAVLSFYGFDASFLLDANLGGRRAQLELLDNASFLPQKPFSYIAEMTYLGVLDSFGIIGLIAYLIGLGGSVFFYARPGASKVRICLMLGLVDYLFISISDGAIHYIPVLAFYWFVVSLLARKNLDIEITS
ncbi:MAG: hypothetical protein A3E80_01805 [Chlamydiae bacterium RIFCSPHIGHO2_12_FULL_49_9]|nr:MAG: hypothetical protein A3E80_01805 [Chlamydiae bacterium RIFCSPHIGHO2_12_FULL_49_9]HLB52721.1 hypothetical protein [Chlamydiales bacterium]